jgi:copper transport protein
MLKPRLRSVLVLFLAALLFVGAAASVQAHAEVVRSSPGDGASLANPPAEMRIWFSEAVQADLSQVRLLDASGASFPTQLRGDPADDTLLVVTLPKDLPHGTYNVIWKSVSAADGHAADGRLVFSIGVSGAEGAGVAPVPTIHPLEVVLRWLNFLALAGVMGAFAAVGLVLRRSGATAQAREAGIAETLAMSERRVWRWGGWVAVGGLVVGLAMLAWQSRDVGGSLNAGMIGQTLVSGRWGGVWVAYQVLLAALAYTAFNVGRVHPDRSASPSGLPERAGISPALWSVSGAMLVLLAVAQALAGHAAAAPGDVPLAVAVDTVHLLAAGTWVGGLLALLVGLLPLALSDRAAFSTLVRTGYGAFGPVAGVSVVMVIATGLYSAGQEVAVPAAFLSTPYGEALAAKVALALLVGAFGWLNSMLLHPAVAAPLGRALRRRAGWTPLSLSRLPALVIAESVVGVAVLLAAGLVTSSTPAHHAVVLPSIAGKPGQQTATVDNLDVTFQVTPNQAGRNQMQAQVMDMTPGSQAAPILRVMARFTYLGQDVGVTQADMQLDPQLPMTYQLSGDALSLQGPWQIDVIVRRKGLEDSTASFRWTVAAPPVTTPVLTMAPVLNTAAALMVTLLALGLLIVWLRHRPAGHHEGGARITN